MTQEAQQGRLVDPHHIAAAPVEVTDENDMVQESNTLISAGFVYQASGDCMEAKSAAETNGQDQSIDKAEQPRVAPMRSIGCHEIESYESLLEGCSGLSSIANAVSFEEQGSADEDPGGETHEPRERAATPSPCVDRVRVDLLAVIKDINSILEDSSLTDSQTLEKIRALDHFKRTKSLVPQRVAETARCGKPITLPRSSPETVDLTMADQNEGLKCRQGAVQALPESGELHPRSLATDQRRCCVVRRVNRGVNWPMES